MFGNSKSRAEGFAGTGRADAAGDVELPADHAFPDSVNCIEIGRVAGQRGDVGHAGIHIRCAHGVADRFGLLDDFLVRLVVRAASAFVAVRPAHVEHELGQIEVTLVASNSV